MHEPTMQPLDAADAAFYDLVASSPHLAIDGAAIGHGLPARAIRLDELKPLLLESSTPYEARDAAVADLLRRARGGDPLWAVGLTGVLMPGLRRMANRLTRDYPGDPDCIDAAILAGFIEAVLTSSSASNGLAATLLWSAFRAGRELWVQEVSASINRSERAPDSVAAKPADHPDLVLTRAVRAGVITANEAELIAVTRIERVRIRDLATKLRVTPFALRRRRERAEARLVAYLRSGDPRMSRFARNRGLGGCGTHRGVTARSAGQQDGRHTSTSTQPREEVS
ncbi:MAG: hypothetical protein ACRDRD_11535, partial [Pseudonocardiaceae bacterium]